MRLNFLLVCLIAVPFGLCSLAIAQNQTGLAAPTPEAPLIELPLPWVQNASYRYRVQSGGTAKDGQTIRLEYELTLRIDAASRRGYRISIAASELDALSKEGVANDQDLAMARLALQAMRDQAVVALLDGDGNFQGFEHPEQIGAAMVKAVDSMLATDQAASTTAESQAVMARLKQSMQTPAFVNAAVYKELAGLWTFTGIAMHKGETRAYDDELVLPIGQGLRIPVKGTLQLDTEGAPSGHAWFRMRQQPDPIAMSAAITDFLKQFVPEAQHAEISAKLNSQFNMSDALDMHTRIVDGIPSYYRFERKMNVDVVKRAKFFEMRLLDTHYRPLMPSEVTEPATSGSEPADQQTAPAND